MSFINRQPTGWLGFLGIKNFGRNPSTAADVLAPTWDLSDLYLAQWRTWVNSSQVISAQGNFIAFTPQAGQVWHIHGFGLKTGVLGAGGAVNGCLSMRAGNPAVLVPLTTPGVTPPVGAAWAVALDRPIILAANESLSYDVTEFAGANLNVILKICYTQLDA